MPRTCTQYGWWLCRRFAGAEIVGDYSVGPHLAAGESAMRIHTGGEGSSKGSVVTLWRIIITLQ